MLVNFGHEICTPFIKQKHATIWNKSNYSLKIEAVLPHVIANWPVLFTLFSFKCITDSSYHCRYIILSLLSSLHLKLDTIVSYLSTNKHGGLGDLNRHRLFTCSVRRESDYSVIYSKSICSEIVNFGNVPFILNLLYSCKINVNYSLAFITDFWESD